MCDGSDLFLCVLAVLFPPIGVWVKRGICSADSLINIALCALGYLPGLLHAWYIISAYPDPGYEQVSQEERVVYIVQGAPGQGYGTVQPHGQFPGQQAGTANAFVNKQPKKAPKMAAPRAQPPAAGSSSQAPASAPAHGAESAAENSSSDPAPPSYSEAVKGDFKVQHD